MSTSNFGRYGPVGGDDCVANSSSRIQNMMVVCKDQLERLGADHRLGPDGAAAAARANAGVEREIASILSGRSVEQLNILQRQIQTKLSSGEPVDTDYWENLLKSLLVWKAKVCVHHPGPLSILMHSKG